MKRFVGHSCSLSVFLLSALAAIASSPTYDNLVDIKTVDPTILVDLRYAAPNNVTGHALYPPDLPALLRPGTAQRLARAQAFLRPRHFGLKVWDAYRPLTAQMELWKQVHSGAFVADPLEGDGSLHTWGVAVDVTLVDDKGQEVAMPSSFDEFTTEAKMHYDGHNPTVKAHLQLLQGAMRHAGFYGLRTEWWHFVALDWKKYAPMREAKKLTP
jgi:D-alanyl-D-alanine dipeptidase